MRRKEREILLVLAVVLIMAGMSLIVRASLPERADFTGAVIEGQRFAPEIGALAPPFTLQSLDGSERSLLDLRGRPVVVNFWATWCEPCVVEMPELQAFQNEAGSAAHVIAVNLGETVAQAEGWLRERDLTLDVVFDTDLRISELYALRGQPTTFIISPDGRITAIFYGATTQSALLDAVRPWLSQET